MLLYHPATDFYHCWMRFASILGYCGEEGAEFDRIRIIDFFSCFPQEIRGCKLPGKHSAALRKELKQLPKLYEDQKSIRQAFSQMSKVQGQVAMDMVAKGIVQRDRYRDGILFPSLEPAARQLLQSVAQEWCVSREEWYRSAVSVLLSMPLNGQDGLKDRSSLLEFRYDG